MTRRVLWAELILEWFIAGVAYSLGEWLTEAIRDCLSRGKRRDDEDDDA